MEKLKRFIASCMIASCVFSSVPAMAATTGGVVQKNVTMSTTTPVLLMKKGTTYFPKIKTNADSIIRKSANEKVATVTKDGKIKAVADGNTYITYSAGNKTMKIYVNVITKVGSGSQTTVKLYNQSGTLRSYKLYRQGGRIFGKYNRYMASHGCAVSSLTSVLGAYNTKYANYKPNQVIDTIEKETVPASDWRANHVTKSNGSQMPISMYGISQILKKAGVNATYVRTFKNTSEAKEQIFSHLKTGNPVIFEVRKKSNKTGVKSKKWTGSVHTMVFLGRYTTGEVLVSDSVNRSWYKGGQRAKIVNINSPLEYMYSCTDFNKSMYYKNISSDGGYILVNE